MNAEDVVVDFNQLKNDKQKNFRQRLWFISFNVKNMKKDSDKVWSKYQADFIDAQFDMSARFYENFGKTERGKEILRKMIEERKAKH